MNSQSSSTVSPSALLEQRRLFNFGKRQSSSSGSKPKSSKKKKELTHTLKFVCLSSKDAVKPRTTVKERTDLANSSLGAKSITFVENESVYNTVLDNYPQLAEVGGFDFLLYQRGGGSDGGFHMIKPPHTANRMKDLCGQAKIYIRPVQKDIPLISKCSSDATFTVTVQSMEEDTNFIESSQVCILNL